MKYNIIYVSDRDKIIERTTGNIKITRFVDVYVDKEDITGRDICQGYKTKWIVVQI